LPNLSVPDQTKFQGYWEMRGGNYILKFQIQVDEEWEMGD